MPARRNGFTESEVYQDCRNHCIDEIGQVKLLDASIIWQSEIISYWQSAWLVALSQDHSLGLQREVFNGILIWNCKGKRSHGITI